MQPEADRRNGAVYATLVALLAVSVVIGESWNGPWVTVAVLVLAVTKVAVVVGEYMEARGSTRWLIGLWCAWGIITTTALITVITLL